MHFIPIFLVSVAAAQQILPITLPNNSSPNPAHAIQRVGRQVVFYYTCGTHPYYFYSTKRGEHCNDAACNQLELCPTSRTGYKLNVGCTNAIQCTPYFQGPVKCEAGCCCTAPSAPAPPPKPAPSPPTTQNSGVCYHGQLSQVVCSTRGQCASGQTCMNGLCCTTTGNEYTAACGGLAAVSSCTNGGCSNGMFCSSSNYCCECPVGRSAGRCNNGACPNGFKCQANGYCCASCPNNIMPYGACRDGKCGGGKTCGAGNICC